MLITKEVTIKVNNRYLRKYEELGYGRLKQGDFINIPIDELPINSSIMVDIKCDFCNDILHKTYYSYNANINNGGKYSCIVCKPLQYKEICMEKYGVDNISKLESTHKKIKETSLIRYGVESYTKLDSFKEDHRVKMMEKYGVDSFSKTDEFLIKQKETCLIRFGVENASQNSIVFSKQQKKRFEIKEFRNSGLYYQGSYEKDFLNRYYDLLEIVKMQSIDYIFDGNRVYYPDFYLPKYNLIVEVKSSYTYEKYLDKNISKMDRCLELGYNFIFIIDKNYDELLSII